MWRCLLKTVTAGLAASASLAGKMPMIWHAAHAHVSDILYWQDGSTAKACSTFNWDGDHEDGGSVYPDNEGWEINAIYCTAALHLCT